MAADNRGFPDVYSTRMDADSCSATAALLLGGSIIPMHVLRFYYSCMPVALFILRICYEQRASCLQRIQHHDEDSDWRRLARA